MAVESPTSSLITAVINQTLLLQHAALAGGGQASSPAPPEAFSGSSVAASSTAGLFDTIQQQQQQGNGSANESTPEIPAYIRNTSMIFCVVIMCLGVIGNIMVSFDWEGEASE